MIDAPPRPVLRPSLARLVWPLVGEKLLPDGSTRRVGQRLRAAWPGPEAFACLLQAAPLGGRKKVSSYTLSLAAEALLTT